MHIAVAGNIGSGKTTLTTMLAKHYGWRPQFEPVIDNPYLEDYYRDIRRWSLNLEIYFLKERFKGMLEIGRTDETIIQDRSIFEGVYVFAYNNKEQGNMTDTDFQTYMDLFNLMMSFTRVPDLMIYLRASVPHLVSNIQQRGRDYEQRIALDYLQGLNDRYEDFIYHHYKGRVLTVEVDNLDFLHRPADFEQITRRIDGLLFGLFN
ncbi:MAG: deoxynucleoside kinase [Bacteroidaceae bacterium]|nr:deoxynucleoside kinase [Bacteroidaceae bacterium]